MMATKYKSTLFFTKLQPKIRMYSKYERRTDTRTYEDRKTLYEGVSIILIDWYNELKLFESAMNVLSVVYLVKQLKNPKTQKLKC